MVARLACLTGLFVVFGLGQNPAPENIDRVFTFRNTEGEQQLQEITTVMRSIVDMRQITLDPAKRTLAVKGNAAQIALTEWLMAELDRVSVRESSVHRYAMANTTEGAVRVFHVAHTDTVQSLQEMATMVRAVGEVRRLFTYNAPRVIVMRDTEERMALMEWLLHEADRSVAPDGPAPEYRMAEMPEGVVRVYWLKHADTVQRLQQIAVKVRSSSRVRRLFTYNATRLLTVRGTEDQMKLVTDLVAELDRPTN